MKDTPLIPIYCTTWLQEGVERLHCRVLLLYRMECSILWVSTTQKNTMITSAGSEGEPNSQPLAAPAPRRSPVNGMEPVDSRFHRYPKFPHARFQDFRVSGGEIDLEANSTIRVSRPLATEQAVEVHAPDFGPGKSQRML